MSKKKKENKTEKSNYWIAIGMCLGISIGTAIGAATNNMALCIPTGLSIGLCLGIALSNKDGDEDK